MRALNEGGLYMAPSIHPQKLIRRQDRLRKLLPYIQTIRRPRRLSRAQKLRARTLLGIRRRAAIRQAEREADALLLARSLLLQALRKRLRGLDGEFAVEHEELLLRHRCHGAARARHIRVGEVEQRHQRIWLHAADLRI